MPDTETLLEVKGLKTHFFAQEGTVRAVDGVNLTVPRGKTVCVVGESGCGKSVTARSILGLVDRPGRIVAGQILWQRNGLGEESGRIRTRMPSPAPVEESALDLATLDPTSEQMRKIRGREIAMVFQEPMASLSPMYTIGAQLIEATRLHLPMDKQQARDHAISMLSRVGIPRPDQRLDAYSFQLSGGMCQRAMIAIALACGPSLLIADEPTTALDVTTQARILDLIRSLQADTGMSVMFITHDLGVVAEIADEVAVMYLGTVVERGGVEEIFADPKHPYTQALLRSIPAVGHGVRQRLLSIRGTVPHPSQRPTGCPFHPRCDHAIAGLCDSEDPPAVTVGPHRQVRCVLHADVAAGPDSTAARQHAPATPVQRPVPTGEAPAAQPDRPSSAAPTVTATRLSDRITPAGGKHPLLDVRDLSMSYPIKKGGFGRTTGSIQAVSGVDLSIRAGETVGLVGESGCGKTTLGRCIVRSLDPVAGQILYRDPDGHQADLTRLRGRQLRPYKRQIRLIFQDPFSSLNPRMTLLQIIGDALRANHVATGSELEDRVANMLRLVGLPPGYMLRYPHAFSGGERQRVNIARALILEPRLVIADEPVSALDVSVRAQILNLLRELQDQLGLTYLFISHDLSVVEYICDRVAVMYLGKIVEVADTTDLYAHPQHPYTEALLAAVPRPDPQLRDSRRISVADELPDPANRPAGCAFHTRCNYTRQDRCTVLTPELREIAPQHRAACHHAESLTLSGIRELQ